MLVALASALGIYQHDLVSGALVVGAFGVFHWLTVTTLVLVLVGFSPRRAKNRAAWAYLYPACIVAGYYLLVSGAINEAFVRVDWLRRVALATAPHVPLFQTQLLGFAQAVCLLVFVAMLIYFEVKVVRSRYRARPRVIAS
jgi:uncharacterized membrane protein